MHSQFFNPNSLTNSTVELNNLLNSQQISKLQNNMTMMNDSISQILQNDSKIYAKPKILSNSQTKGKFILAKRLSEVVLANTHHQFNGQQQNASPLIQEKLQQPQEKLATISLSISKSISNNASMPNLQKIVQPQNIQSIRLLPKLNEEAERIKKQNIFNVKDKHLNNQYVEFNQGPRFRDGKVVAYTIVGSPQLFTKYYNNQEGLRTSIKEQPAQVVRSIRKKNTMKYPDGMSPNANYGRGNSMTIINQNTQSSYAQYNNSNMNQTNSENFSESRLNTNYQHKSSFKKHSGGMNSTGMTNVHKKKYRNSDFEEVNKEELVYDMSQTKLRIKQNEETQYEKELQMNFEQRQLLNREKRILEKYNKTISQWAKDVSKVSSFSHRKPEQSLMLKSDDYRKKVEIQNAFDGLKSDEQRFGQRIWYMMLRKSNVKSDNRIINSNDILKNTDNDQDVYLSKSNIRKFVNYSQQADLSKLKDSQIFDPREQTQSDIFSNFMTVTVNNPYKPIEVVRKSIGEKKQLNLTNPFNTTQSSYFMNTQSFLESKIQENMNLLKNRIVMPNDNDMQELIIEGKNLYDIELDSLMNDGNSNNYKYEKLNFIKAAAHQNNKDNNNANNAQKQNEQVGSRLQSAIQSMHELDDEKVYEKLYDVGELSKTGRHFFKDL